MRPAFSRTCVLAIVVVACAVVSAPALADASQPIGLSAVARSDHLVELTWSWPASPTYPDELDVYRDGTFVASVAPASSTSFADTIDSLSAPGTAHHYYLVTVTGGITDTPTATTPDVTLRQDLPNKPTGVAASFGPGTNNIATVTWQRGDMDADVTYTVTAQQVGGGPITTRTIKYPVDGTDGSLTMDGFNSYTSYVFKVSAVEDVGDPTGDPGGTANANASATAQSFDVLAPQFNGGTPSATTVSLGTITVTWPPATDAGSGVESYLVCIDGAPCTSVPFNPLAITQSATPGPGQIRNDGATHTVSVVAVDDAGNQSSPITVPITMPLPATPVLALGAVNGCAPLVVTPTSSDSGSPAPTFHVFVDGSTEVPFGSGNPIGGAPYQVVQLTATATYGPDSSLTSATFLGHVEDPTGPTTSPQVHGTAGSGSGTEVLDWDQVTEPSGAPVIGYMVTSLTIPGYEDGKFVAQASHVQLPLGGLVPTDGYNIDVTSVDSCQRQSPVPTRIHFVPNDNSPPTVPVLNTPTAGGNDVKLSWAPSTDNVAVDGYSIYKNGVYAGETSLTSFDVTPLPEAYSATYTVIASDTVGNRSAASAPRTATTRDMTPPSPPAGTVHPSVQDGNISLSWGAASDNVAVAGYQVFRLAANQTTPTLVYQGPALSFTDRNVPAGTYTYSVVAYDASNHVSSAKTATDVVSTGSPIATKASTLRLVKKGTKVFRVGGASGARIVLLFTLKQPFARAVVRLHVLAAGVTGKARAKLRISLPAGSGRNMPGKRLGERTAKKGTISIPVGHQKAGVLRLVVTATGGTLTLAGTGAGAHAPTIVSGS